MNGHIDDDDGVKPAWSVLVGMVSAVIFMAKWSVARRLYKPIDDNFKRQVKVNTQSFASIGGCGVGYCGSGSWLRWNGRLMQKLRVHFIDLLWSGFESDPHKRWFN